MVLMDVTDESRCCCSCLHNKRTYDYTQGIHCRCHCEKDGHYIGYVANFETICEEWEKDKT